MDARVTAESQQYRLRDQLASAKVKHGESARVNIPLVRVVAYAGNEQPAVVYFCNVEPITVHKRMVPGDSAPLPESVVLDGVTFPGTGDYDLIDAIVVTNGNIRIAADERTRVQTHGAEARNRIARLFSTAIW